MLSRSAVLNHHRHHAPLPWHYLLSTLIKLSCEIYAVCAESDLFNLTNTECHQYVDFHSRISLRNCGAHYMLIFKWKPMTNQRPTWVCAGFAGG